MQWNDCDAGSVGITGGDGILRILWHDGEQFVCDWKDDKPIEQWLLDSVPDMAAAKAVVESWETPEGWEDDE